MPEHDAGTLAKLDEVMRSAGFTGVTRLYRHTLPEFLADTDDPGVQTLTANSDPSESVVDVYAQGHVSVAVHIGPGLAFVESPNNQWQESGRTAVAVRLRDVLDQGGLIYPVETVITDRVWYLTLPEGSVRVSDATSS